MLKKINSVIIISFILSAVLTGGAIAQAGTDTIIYKMDIIDDIAFLPADSISQQFSDNGNNVIRLNQTGNTFPMVRFPIANPNQYVAVEFDFKISSATGGGYVNIWDNDAANRAMSLYINNAGFSFNGHTNAPTISTKYRVGSWCHVQFIGNYSPTITEQKLNLVIDGVMVARGVAFRNQLADKTMDRLDFDLRNNIDLFVDNVKAYSVNQDEYNHDYMVNQNFDNCIAIPSTYTTTGANTTLESEYVKIYNGGSMGVPVQNTSIKEFTVEFSMRTDGTGEKTIQLKSGSLLGVHMYARNGKLGFKPPNGSYNDFFDLSLNEWHTVKMDVDSQAYLYDVYVDGALAKKDIPFRGNYDILNNLTLIGASAQNLYIDNIKMVSLIVPEGIFGLTDSKPKNNGVFSLVNPTVTLNFNCAIDAGRVANSNFVLTGNGVIPALSNITVADKKIVLNFTDIFEYGKDYTLTIQNLRSTNGQAMASKIINFKTADKKDILVDEPTFSVGGNEITNLQSGTVMVQIAAKNISANSYNGVVVAVVKKDGYLTDIYCSDLKQIDSVETKFQTEITVDDSKNSVVEVYFWNGFSKAISYVDTYKIDKDGVGYLY